MSTGTTTTVPSQHTQEDGQAPTPSIQRIKPKDWSGEHKITNLLREENWQSWRDDISLTFDVCCLQGYVNGTLKCPDPITDPIGADNWTYNDKYTQKVIRDRQSDGQKYHTSHCKTAKEMWTNLKAIHQSCGDQTENQLMRELTAMTANDGDDIIKHLAKLKQLWDRITLVCQSDLPLPPKLFKKFLAYSLPTTWDEFTRQFSRDPAKKDLTIHEFIGECNEEYRRRQKRDNKDENGNQSAYATTKKTLINRIGKKSSNQAQKQNQRCTHCGRDNHTVENCYHAAKPKCTICKKIGHKEDQCRFKKKTQKPRKGKEKMVADAITLKKETNIAEAGSDEENLAAIGDDHSMIIDDPFFDNIYDYNNNVNYEGLASNTTDRMYEWLAGSGSTNHISNRRELFSSYELTPEATVHGVGGKITQVVGRGTVNLTAQIGTRKRTLRLEKVNYIPSNKYNIFALGRWDSQGRRYQASNGELILYNRQNAPVLKGRKIASNVYKFILTPTDAPLTNKNQIYTFSCKEAKQTWETWHRRFGHVSYKGLKKLFQERLLDGFTVDQNTPTPDCTSCTEAKQSVKSFGTRTESTRKNKGELTHIDLWGKYDVTSINGHQYYLLLVDDATRYVTVYFLKGKHEAAQHVKNYLTYLHVRGISTHAIRVDRGTEFINKDLKEWCHAKGMEIDMTAPYSPSQNGVAERMNRTLVELARAMLTASKLPEYLWEPAVAHAAAMSSRP